MTFIRSERSNVRKVIDNESSFVKSTERNVTTELKEKKLKSSHRVFICTSAESNPHCQIRMIKLPNMFYRCQEKRLICRYVPDILISMVPSYGFLNLVEERTTEIHSFTFKVKSLLLITLDNKLLNRRFITYLTERHLGSK